MNFVSGKSLYTHAAHDGFLLMKLLPYIKHERDQRNRSSLIIRTILKIFTSGKKFESQQIFLMKSRMMISGLSKKMCKVHRLIGTSDGVPPTLTLLFLIKIACDISYVHS